MQKTFRDSHVRSHDLSSHESDSSIYSTRFHQRNERSGAAEGGREHHRFCNKESVGALRRVDIIFSNDSVARKGSESSNRNKTGIQQKSAQRRSGPSQQPIRAAYRRTLERESVSALAFLSTCNAEIANEIHFLEGELAAFHRLEQAQLAEMQDLKNYAPQTCPPSLQIEPPPSPPRTTATAPRKIAFASEAPSQPCGAGQLPCAPHPAATVVSDGAEPEQQGGRAGWCGGGWKKALRKRP